MMIYKRVARVKLKKIVLVASLFLIAHLSVASHSGAGAGAAQTRGACMSKLAVSPRERSGSPKAGVAQASECPPVSPGSYKSNSGEESGASSPVGAATPVSVAWQVVQAARLQKTGFVLVSQVVLTEACDNLRQAGAQLDLAAGSNNSLFAFLYLSRDLARQKYLEKSWGFDSTGNGAGGVAVHDFTNTTGGTHYLACDRAGSPQVVASSVSSSIEHVAASGSTSGWSKFGMGVGVGLLLAPVVSRVWDKLRK